MTDNKKGAKEGNAQQPQIDPKSLSVTELKALVYDEMALQEQSRQRAQFFNQIISEKLGNAVPEKQAPAQQ